MISVNSEPTGGRKGVITCSLGPSGNLSTVFLECDTLGAKLLIATLQELIEQGGSPHAHIDLIHDSRFDIRADQLIIDYNEVDLSDEF